MLIVQVDNNKYSDFMSIQFSSSMTEFNNECSFSIALENGEKPPFSAGDNVSVFIDSEKVMTGYIYQAEVSYSHSQHSISYVCADNSIDFADSYIDNLNGLAETVSLKKVIEEVLSHIGSGIKVIDGTSGIKPFTAEDGSLTPETGDNCFDYCERICTRRQVLMRTNADGDIELIRNSGENYETPLLNVVSDTGKNNIISSTYLYNSSESFRKYISRSNKPSKSTFLLSDSRENSKANIELADQNGEYTDEKNRAGRQIVLMSPESSGNSDNEEQAKWLADQARANKINYSVTIISHSLGDQPLKANMLARVQDDFTGISSYMLIESIACSVDLQGGEKSVIKLVDKDSFALSLSDPSRRYRKAEETTGLTLEDL